MVGIKNCGEITWFSSHDIKKSHPYTYRRQFQTKELFIKFVFVNECDRHVFASGQDIEALVNSYKGRSFTACLS